MASSSSSSSSSSKSPHSFVVKPSPYSSFTGGQSNVGGGSSLVTPSGTKVGSAEPKLQSITSRGGGGSKSSSSSSVGGNQLNQSLQQNQVADRAEVQRQSQAAQDRSRTLARQNVLAAAESNRSEQNFTYATKEKTGAYYPGTKTTLSGFYGSDDTFYPTSNPSYVPKGYNAGGGFSTIGGGIGIASIISQPSKSSNNGGSQTAPNLSLFNSSVETNKNSNKGYLANVGGLIGGFVTSPIKTVASSIGTKFSPSFIPGSNLINKGRPEFGNSFINQRFPSTKATTSDVVNTASLGLGYALPAKVLFTGGIALTGYQGIKAVKNPTPENLAGLTVSGLALTVPTLAVKGYQAYESRALLNEINTKPINLIAEETRLDNGLSLFNFKGKTTLRGNQYLISGERTIKTNEGITEGFGVTTYSTRAKGGYNIKGTISEFLGSSKSGGNLVTEELSPSLNKGLLSDFKILSVNKATSSFAGYSRTRDVFSITARTTQGKSNIAIYDSNFATKYGTGKRSVEGVGLDIQQGKSFGAPQSYGGVSFDIAEGKAYGVVGGNLYKSKLNIIPKENFDLAAPYKPSTDAGLKTIVSGSNVRILVKVKQPSLELDKGFTSFSGGRANTLGTYTQQSTSQGGKAISNQIVNEIKPKLSDLGISKITSNANSITSALRPIQGAYTGLGLYEKTSQVYFGVPKSSITGLSVADFKSSANNGLLTINKPSNSNTSFTNSFSTVISSSKLKGITFVAPLNRNGSGVGSSTGLTPATSLGQTFLTPQQTRQETTTGLIPSFNFGFSRYRDFTFDYPQSFSGYLQPKTKKKGRKSSFDIAPSFTGIVQNIQIKNPVKVSSTFGVTPFQTRGLLVGRKSKGAYFKLVDF